MSKKWYLTVKANINNVWDVVKILLFLSVCPNKLMKATINNDQRYCFFRSYFVLLSALGQVIWSCQDPSYLESPSLSLYLNIGVSQLISQDKKTNRPYMYIYASQFVHIIKALKLTNYNERERAYIYLLHLIIWSLCCEKPKQKGQSSDGGPILQDMHESNWRHLSCK